MIIEIDPEGAEFRKRAEDRSEAARLGREADMLAAARHPGVIQLLGWDGLTLRLRLVDGVPVPSAVTAQLAVAAATTLADLHEIGVAHGAVTAEHIIVDRNGDPVLCGFGQARTGVAPDGPEAAADVAALAAVLGARTDGDTQRAVLARAAAPGRRRPPTARQLARRLASPPAAGGPSSSSRRRKIGAPGALIVVAVVAVVAVVVAAAGALAHAGAPAHPARPHPAGAPCPAADRGCRPLPHPAGALSVEQQGRRYRIGQPDDVVVLGRWNCGVAHAALLQPGSGTIWVFDQWAPGTARLVTHVPGAASLQVDAGPNGCDHLRVIGARGAAVVVHPNPGS